jgi:polysaccharide biosynthesis protein PslH
LRILFLSQRVPYPPNRGDKITTWRLIERMRRHHEVRCIAFSHGAADEAGAQELRAKGISIHTVPYHDRAAKLRALPLLLTRQPLTLGVYGSAELQRLVDQELPACDLAYAYSSSMGAFLEPHARIPRVMHFGELDSDKWRQYSTAMGAPMSWVYAREARTLLAFERRIAQSFAENVVCTELERRVFLEAIPGSHCVVLQNGVDLEYFHPRDNQPQPLQLAFTGVMNYHPNAEGCIWFVQSILPLIRARHPQVRFTIIGSHPTAAVQALAQSAGVEVTGFVTDTREHLRRASVSVAPLRIARGIQNKVLEAMAMGLPVVGTTPATQGVGARDGEHYLVRDREQDFAQAVIRLLDDAAERQRLAGAARAFVEAHYNWEHVFAPLDTLLARLAPQPHSSPA